LDDLLRELPSPQVYPQKIDAGGNVFLVRMDEAGYRAASFLDDRILDAKTQGAWAPPGRVKAAMGVLPAARPLHFIFHIGHVGSTLLSRLLDEGGGEVLSLREPYPLRQLADRPEAGLVELFLRLWSRGFPSTQAVVVKATSSAARIAPLILAARPDAHAVYMYVAAEPYLATLLAGENSPIDLKGHQAERTARLAAHLGTPPPPVASLGELAALSWLAERLTMEKVGAGHPGRVFPLDFETLLADVEAVMTVVMTYLGLRAGAAAVRAMAQSPALGRYSKAPEHAYSPSLRAQILAQSRRNNAAEIARGMAWLAAPALREPAARLQSLL
jgi:hypothetical protein